MAATPAAAFLAASLSNIDPLSPPTPTLSLPVSSPSAATFPCLGLGLGVRSLSRQTRIAASPAPTGGPAATNPPATTTPLRDARVRRIHSIEEFDDALKQALNRLVVVEYAGSKSYHSHKIYPFMVELSRNCSDVDFLLVVGDESDATRALCNREGIDRVPHFTFYKSQEKVHEEEGIEPGQLADDVLYYGDAETPVKQLHSREEAKAFIEESRADKRLVVLDVGLKHCGPCVKVYPTVVKLSRQMAGTVAFARMNGDENESCMKFLREMDVVEVPTFLFIRDGRIRGRYVGSGKGELIGEILRYQGVRVT
ncbi:hypothetical protein AMTRI_Chr09g14920 [Amborella trichopoda]